LRNYARDFSILSTISPKLWILFTVTCRIKRSAA